MHLRARFRKRSRFLHTIRAYSLERDTIMRSLKAALVIGTLLGRINHGQALVSGHFTRSELVPLRHHLSGPILRHHLWTGTGQTPA